MTTALLERVKTSRVELETKYGQTVEGTLTIDSGRKLATLSAPKVKGWRGAHGRYMRQARPGAQLKVDYTTEVFAQGETSGLTKWSIR